MSVNFSWGSNKDHDGKVIDANATKLNLPTSATDADIALIAHLCKQLQTLNLRGCDNITDAGLLHIAELQQLQTLNLGGCDKITDAGLQHLATLQQLQELNLYNCPQITDAGLQHIGSLQQLQKLQTYGTQP